MKLPSIGETLDETYEIERLLGQGGFGAVYLARQLSMDRPVALKVLVAHAMKVEEMIERFRREVMAVKNLAHPNTIRIYDFRDGSDGLLYYAMEYVKGPNLKQVLRKEGPVAPNRVKHIIRQVLKSLSEAHSYGIVHRDLKPANIMLADMHGETDFVKVLDFGIAKIIDDSGDAEEQEQLTNAGVLVGTLRYMSPEQIASEGIGPQSDLYALGLIGIEMLTGQSVFEGTGRWEILHQQISEEPIEIPEVVLQNPLGELFQRALLKDPNQRFQQADEMLKALDKIGDVGDTLLVDRATWEAQKSADSTGSSRPGSGVNRPTSNSGNVSSGGRPTSQSGPISESSARGPQTPTSEPVKLPTEHLTPVEQSAEQRVGEKVPAHQEAPASFADAKTQVVNPGQSKPPAVQQTPARSPAHTPTPRAPQERNRDGSRPGAASPEPSSNPFSEQSSEQSGLSVPPQSTPSADAPESGSYSFASPAQTTGETSKSRLPAMAIIGVAAAVVLLLAGAFYVFTGDEGDSSGTAESGAVALGDGKGIDETPDPEPGSEATGDETPTDEAVDRGEAAAETKEGDDATDGTWVRIESPDVEAKVFEDDQEIGNTPIRVNVRGEQIYVLKADDHRDRVVELGPDSDSRVEVEMEQVEEEPEEVVAADEVKPDEPADAKPDRPARDDKPSSNAGDEEGADDWVDIPSSRSDDKGDGDKGDDDKDGKSEVPLF